MNLKNLNIKKFIINNKAIDDDDGSFWDEHYILNQT